MPNPLQFPMFQSPVSPAAASVAIPGYPSMARPMPQPKPAYIPFSPTGPVAQPDPPFKLDGIRVADPELIESLYILSKTENLPRDEAYLRSLGVNIMFHNGRQAIDVLRKRGVSIIFSDMGDSTAHAEWVSDMNLIKINQRYKDDRSLPTLYALSEAIFHEAGHALWVVFVQVPEVTGIGQGFHPGFLRFGCSEAGHDAF